MAKIAWIGVGAMGGAIILRLLAAGHAVTAYNRSVEKTRRAREAGAVIAASPREAAQGAEVVFSSVTNDEASRAVWTGSDGVLAAALPPSTIVVECSTLSHDWVMELAALASKKGVRYVDCPVAGRPHDAEAGKLRVFAGATPADLEAVRPLLEAFSTKIFHFGGVGAGTAFKLIYNLLGVIQVASVGEAMAQCEAAGIDLHAAAEGFATGYTGSRHVTLHSATMADGKQGQAVAFSGRGRLKDAQYGVRLAEKMGRQSLVGNAAVAVFSQMVDVGMGDANDSELIDALRAVAAKARKS